MANKKKRPHSKLYQKRKRLENLQPKRQLCDQQVSAVASEQSQETAKPLTYKEWIASLPKSTAVAAEETLPSAPPPHQQLPTPGPSTSSATGSHTTPTLGPSRSSAPESHTMTFRDWVAAQTEKAAPANTETLSIYLPESEIVVKEEVADVNIDPDILGSAGQAMDTLIVDFDDTSFEQDDMNCSTEIIDQTDMVPIKSKKRKVLPSNTEKRRSLRDKNALLNKTLTQLNKSPKKTQLKSLLKPLKTNNDQSLSKKRPSHKKPIMFDRETTTEGLVYSINKSTSTEDLLAVKPENERRELFLQLCEEFLDEGATAAIRLTLNSRPGPGW
ncbi:hypothetical protein O0L34_g5564 [Tuta absoluta]|nr:hypothetical protein O0L34_g5564 [Tuta absoluta]